MKIDDLEVSTWLKLNASLQKKKNRLRMALKEKGVLKKGGINNYDKYSYFSEAQYKALFTELFATNGLELSFTEIEYTTFSGSEKQANGRMPRIKFILTDIDSGFYEETIITGEGIDKGDKAGYKAYTGALKYYLANTFMVATGDDPEKESPSHAMNSKDIPKATEKQVKIINGKLDDYPTILKKYGVEKTEDLSIKQASDIISRIFSKEASNGPNR